MDRMNWLDALIAAAILILLAVLLPTVGRAAEETKAPVWETYVIPSGEGALSISDQPCTVPSVMEYWEAMRARVMAQANVDIGPVRQSRLLWKGHVYAGCYVIGPDNGHVYNMDSEGDPLMPTIPRVLFVPHEGALPVGGTKV